MSNPSLSARLKPAIDLDAPAALEYLTMGYQVSQAVYVAAQLGVAELLADGPKTATELAEATGAHAASLSRLLRALAAFAVLDQVGPDQFALTPIGDCLRADAPNSIRDTVLMRGNPISGRPPPTCCTACGPARQRCTTCTEWPARSTTTVSTPRWAR